MTSRAPQIRMPLRDVLAVADRRPPGYVEAILVAGQTEGDTMVIEAGALKAIQERFGTATAPPAGGCQGCGR